jgi:hypothetical protein
MERGAARRPAERLDPDDLDAAHRTARGRRPVTDPEVPPLPPHITFEQAKMFALAVAKGDPSRLGMIEQSIKDKLEEFLPGRR